MYNSLATIAFTVRHVGKEPTQEELETALLERVKDVLREGCIEECCLPVEDTFEEEEYDA